MKEFETVNKWDKYFVNLKIAVKRKITLMCNYLFRSLKFKAIKIYLDISEKFSSETRIENTANTYVLL